MEAEQRSDTPERESPSSVSVGSGESILGLATDELAGVKVEELLNNATAIKMILHYYRKLVDDNKTQRNEINTLKTYVDAYNQKQFNVTVGAPLMVLSNLMIAFAVNLITGAFQGATINPLLLWAGIGLFLPGFTITVVGVYFSMFKDQRP